MPSEGLLLEKIRSPQIEVFPIPERDIFVEPAVLVDYMIDCTQCLALGIPDFIGPTLSRSSGYGWKYLTNDCNIHEAHGCYLNGIVR